jgi:CrcB protein
MAEYLFYWVDGKMEMRKLIYVGIGGFIGACLRYLVSTNSSELFGTEFPYGTLIVNVVGGLLIGFIMELSLTTDLISPNLRLFLTTGIMGGLTTFSTFSYETISLFNDGSYMLGTLNTCLNLFLSLGGVVLGEFVSHIIAEVL